MVRTAVPTLGYRRPVCLARPILSSAEYDSQSGYHTSAGVKLLEATRRYLIAMSEAYGIRPAKSPRRVVKQLIKAKVITDGPGQWLLDIIDIGRKCQQCRHVDPSSIEFAISILRGFLDAAHELDLPTRGGAV